MDEIRKLKLDDFPELLKQITDPPEDLYLRGALPPNEYKWLCVVGSRKYTNYGREVCEKLLAGLRGYPIVVVSGLALGIDALAHKSALEVGLKTVSVPGSGLADKVLYPKTNFSLAKKILVAGGALVSEYEPDFKATPWSFPQRNRVMAGMSHATLVIEAEEKSGTLITARLAMEYNRDVMTVPGSIFSRSSAGPHMLIRNGATPITSSADILEALGLGGEEDRVKTAGTNGLSESEQKVADILETEPLPKDKLIQKLDMSTSQANILLSAMEIKGLISEQMGKIRIK